jgi:hypothetical protein
MSINRPWVNDRASEWEKPRESIKNCVAICGVCATRLIRMQFTCDRDEWRLIGLEVEI